VTVFSKGTRSHLRGYTRQLIDEVRTRKGVEERIAHPERLQAQLDRLTFEDCVEYERSIGVFGPYSRQHYLKGAPDQVLRNLERSRREGRAGIRMDVQAVAAANAGPTVNPSNFTAVTASATETNLWTPALWTPIPAFTLRADKVYHLYAGGLFTSTATQGVLTWTYRFGQSSTPASNLSLGASNLTAPPASLTNAPWFLMGTLVCRSVGLAASGSTVLGHIFVHVQGAAAATAVDYLAGGTVVTTADHTTAQGVIVSLTISVASQSYVCEYAYLVPQN